MRATARIRRLSAAASTALLLAGCAGFTMFATACNSSSKPEFGSPAAEVQSIAYLKTLCTHNSVRIAQDINIIGTVVGNDEFGEFAKTLIIEDTSGGIEIAIDHTKLSDEYPFGCRVTVSCNGLALGDFGGKIQLGAPPTGDYSVDRIPRRELRRYLRRAEPPAMLVRPTELSFAEVAAQHIDTYVRFDNIRFATQGSWCDRDPATGYHLTTEHTIIDSRGDTFCLRVAASCIYAAEPVPHGTGSLYGVIDYFNGKYSLRITRYGVLFDNEITAAAPPTAYL